MEVNWKTYTYSYPNPGIQVSVESPGILEEAQLEIVSDIKSTISFLHYYAYNVPTFLLAFNIVDYDPIVILNLQGAAEGAMERLANSGLVSNVKPEYFPVINGGIRGVRQVIHCTNADQTENVVFTNLLFLYKTAIFSVITSCNAEHKLETEISDRVLSSVKVKIL